MEALDRPLLGTPGGGCPDASSQHSLTTLRPPRALGWAVACGWSPLWSCVCCFQPLGTSKSAPRPGASSRPGPAHTPHSHRHSRKATWPGVGPVPRCHHMVTGGCTTLTDPPQGIVCVPVKLTIPAEGSDRPHLLCSGRASPGPRLCSLQLGPGGVGGGTRKPGRGRSGFGAWLPVLASGVPHSPRTSAAAFSGMNGRRLAPCMASC